MKITNSCFCIGESIMLESILQRWTKCSIRVMKQIFFFLYLLLFYFLFIFLLLRIMY